MRRTDKVGRPFWLTTVSSNRPSKVRKLEKVIGPTTWYVPEGQGYRYRNAGVPPERLIEVPCPQKNVTIQRKRAMDDAFAKDLACIQVDDDLNRIRHIPFDVDPPCRWPKCPTLQFLEAITIIRSRLEGTDYKLAGVTATPNPFFTKSRVTYNRFCISRFTMTLPNPINLDTQFTIKEDYDHTLQHLDRYGGVVRSEDILFVFTPNPPSTGCNDYRDDEEEKEMIRRLKAKWGDHIRPNRRKPETEVVIKW